MTRGQRGPITSGIGFDLRSLEAYVLTCQKGSMAAAAQRLSMSQPAVSQIIKSLEHSLGVALIDRSHRPLKLTASGAFLRDAAEELLNTAARIPTRLRELAGGYPPGLRIGIVDSLASPFVPELLTRLQPSLQTLSAEAGLAGSLREAFVDSRLDVVITNDPMDDLDGLVGHTIFAEPYVLVVPSHLATGDVVQDLPTLARTSKLIRWSSKSRIGFEIEQQLRCLRITIPHCFEFDSASTIAGIVNAGHGWAIMTPLCLVNSLSELGSARLLPFPGPKFFHRLRLVSRAGELDKITLRLADISREILRTKYLPRVAELGPWLESEISLGP
jgi:DNA-binding transcriptional LysR family regulator